MTAALPKGIAVANGPVPRPVRKRFDVPFQVGRARLPPLAGSLALQAYRDRVESRPWRLLKAGRGRPKHAREILLRHRGEVSAVMSPLARRLPSLRDAKRAPCTFTETALKRALRAVRAAGETPGRIVVTKDGFAVELADDSAAAVHSSPPPEEENLWAKKLD